MPFGRSPLGKPRSLRGAIWRETNEFRSRIADQQSRDVGCLLSGYYIVEDNARRYGLPPLDCGQIYTERD